MRRVLLASLMAAAFPVAATIRATAERVAECTA